MAQKSICAVDGCRKTALVRGWCQEHYDRWRYHGDPTGKRAERVRPCCSIKGCGEPAEARGWCQRHYNSWYSHGDPLFVAPPKAAPKGECSVEGCARNSYLKGFCVSHYQRQLKHGDPLAGRMNPKTPWQWLKDHVAHDGDECLAWPFGRSATGHANHIMVGDRLHHAYRWMCILAHGEPPLPSHEAAHSCGKGHLGCVNPKHLRWATRAENDADKDLHGTRVRGSQISLSKLTEKDVLEIRELYGKFSQREIAKRYGVSAPAIGSIHRYETWAWLK